MKRRPLGLPSMELTNKGIFLAMCVGLAAISLSTMSMIFRPCEIIISMMFKFTEGGPAIALWSKPEIEIFIKVYVFNITNKEAFLAGTEKLKVEEVGPYVYREFMEHGDVTFNDNGTVTAVPIHKLKFIPEMSIGKENDIFYLPNIALLSIANLVVKSKNTFTRVGLNALLARIDAPPIIEQTLRESMFDYESPLITLGNRLLPSWISFDKIGLLDRIYDFDGDFFTAYTGDTDIRSVGLFATYNGLPYLPQWPSPPCNKLAGSSDGVKFPSMIQPNQTLWFFRKSIGRSLPLIQTDLFTDDWIPMARYQFKDAIFDYDEDNAENRCFCVHGPCLRNGLLDVSEWYYGFPIAVSFPHFYKADRTIGEGIEGTKPDADLHETQIYINPQTGVPTKVSVKLQVNLVSEEITSISNCERFSNLVVPLMWLDINVPKLTFFYKALLLLSTRIIPIAETVISYLLLLGGFWFTATSVGALVRLTRVNKNRRGLLKRQKSVKWNKYKDVVRRLSQSIINVESNEYILSVFTSYSNNISDDEDVKIPLTLSSAE